MCCVRHDMFSSTQHKHNIEKLVILPCPFLCNGMNKKPETEGSYLSGPLPWDGSNAGGTAQGEGAAAASDNAPGALTKHGSGRAGIIEGVAGGGSRSTSMKKNRLGAKKNLPQQQQQAHKQQAAGMETGPEQQHRHPSPSMLSPSPSTSLLLPQQHKTLPYGRHQALGRVSVLSKGAAGAGNGSLGGVPLTSVGGSSRVVKGGTRGLFAQVR